jgi:hypothetical protein
MSSPQFHNQAQRFNLHEVELPVVQHDIRQYLLAKLQEIALDNELHGWPLPEDLDLLVEQSAGLFIYASTAVKFIQDPEFLPQERLKIISTPDAARKAGSHTHKLDRLYIQVLEQTAPDNRETIQMIIGSIVLLQTQLPALGSGTVTCFGSPKTQEMLITTSLSHSGS